MRICVHACVCTRVRPSGRLIACRFTVIVRSIYRIGLSRLDRSQNINNRCSKKDIK